MKKSFKYLLLIVSALALILCAVACGSVKSISVSPDHEFQTTYVLGQELNLSGGILNADDGKKVSEIALDSKDVTVSGYDKNLLGKQTLTVEYEGVTTELTVTVVESLTVNNAIVDYLVGDTLDVSKGSVKITNPDGSSRTFPFSSAFVSVSGFDSSTAKSNVELKVVCDLNGEKYEGSLKVNIYAIESVDFRKPNKITYTSHYQGKPDASGGRFILTGNAGAIKREVAISEDMISGLDVTAVNAENSPIKQILTVIYNDEPYTYEVQLTYTDVSMFLDNAEKVLVINWAGESEPVIEPEIGELALELMQAYVDMKVSDRGLIGEELAFNVARTAMVYGFEIWSDNIRQFKDVFAIEYGETVLYLKEYETVKASLPLFEDKDSAIYTLAPLLLEIIELYGDKVIYENEKERIMFSSYPVMDDYQLSVMQGALEHAIAIYELIKDVPNDWKVSGLAPHYSVIGKTATQIMGASYILEFPDLYYLVSDWREENDLFDMIYNYLYDTDEKDVIEYFVIYGLPSQISELYGYVFNAVIVMDDINVKNLKYTDTTKFFYNYFLAIDCAQKIKEQEGTVESYIYNDVPVNLLLGMNGSEDITFEVIFDYMRIGEYGYRHLSGGLLDLQAYDVLMKEYVALVKNTIQIDGYEDTAEYGESIKSIFNHFVALSPSQQYNFLSTLNVLYTRGVPELAFDDLGKYSQYMSYFTVVINNFMRSKLSEEYADTYNNLILAIEVYANRFGYDAWESDFTARMDKVTSDLIQMPDADKANFTYYLGSAYDKYMTIKANINTKADLGEWADEVDALFKALTDMQTAYYSIVSSTSYNYNYFLSSFEKAASIAADILARAPQSVIYAYYHEPLFHAYTDGINGSEEAGYWTLDYAVNVYRNFYIETLLFFDGSSINLYDIYLEKNLDEFLMLYYEMISAFFNKEENESPVFEKEKVLAVIEAFKNLDSQTKSLVMTLEGNINLYYSALELFIAEAFSENAGAVAQKLFSLEANYYTYEVTQSVVTLNAISEILAQLKELHTGLDDSDLASFEPLEGIYNYYVEKCEQLLAE